jgi:hypothetical protein
VAGLLQKRIEPAVRKLFAVASSDEDSVDALKEILTPSNFRLSGIESSNRLAATLNNKKPLI